MIRLIGLFHLISQNGTGMKFLNLFVCLNLFKSGMYDFCDNFVLRGADEDN